MLDRLLSAPTAVLQLFWRVSVLLFALGAPGSTAQLPDALLNFKKYTVQNATRRGAVCGDGSPAIYYFRDCPRPGSECASNPGGAQWIIYFEGGASWDTCWSADTCAARHRRTPSRMSSTVGHPDVLTRDQLSNGIFSDSGEGNPNFYEHRAVWVPSCDSSMWLGDDRREGKAGTGNYVFRGRVIMQAVWEDLQTRVFNPVSVPTPYGPGPNHTRLHDASQVVVVGQAGVMRWLDMLTKDLPPSVHVAGICDGCVLQDRAPLVAVADEPCDSTTAAARCPPREVLRLATSVWGAQFPDDSRGSSWKSLMSPALIKQIRTPLQVQHPQFDILQLQQNRVNISVWPPRKGGADSVYARSWAADLRSMLSLTRPSRGLYTFAPACDGPSGPGALINETGFNHLPISSCRLLGENSTQARLTLAACTSMFLSSTGAGGGGDPFLPVCMDDCNGVDCNPDC